EDERSEGHFTNSWNGITGAVCAGRRCSTRARCRRRGARCHWISYRVGGHGYQDRDSYCHHLSDHRWHPGRTALNKAYTLNRKYTTSPSWISYSFPSNLINPFSRAAVYEPARYKSS